MTTSRLQTNAQMCMYALTLSTTEPKNIKEAMLDYNWIESMQDEINQFQRLDVWEVVERPVGRNIIRVKWLCKNKTDAKNMVFGSTNPFFSNQFAKLMKNNFKMSMMGEMKFFLGLQIHQSPRGIFISQSQYTLKILKKHGMDGCDFISTPLATARINPDLPNHAWCHDDCKSISGGIQFLGDKLVSWSSKKLDCTSMYTTKAEYSAIAISCNPMQHSRTKHINIQYHFTKEHVEQGVGGDIVVMKNMRDASNGVKFVSIYRMKRGRSAAYIIKCAAYLA
ncbi:retrovirus-related pol polyprotein from transposon TNT 1-94 [Tanacetum coccineum]